jgi:hypothetical protein
MRHPKEDSNQGVDIGERGRRGERCLRLVGIDKLPRAGPVPQRNSTVSLYFYFLSSASILNMTTSFVVLRPGPRPIKGLRTSCLFPDEVTRSSRVDRVGHSKYNHGDEQRAESQKSHSRIHGDIDPSK